MAILSSSLPFHALKEALTVVACLLRHFTPCAPAIYRHHIGFINDLILADEKSGLYDFPKSLVFDWALLNHKVPRRPHSGRQFLAVLRKNALLQTRSGRSFLGISGWAALALEILTPAAFFLLMCLPKYYFNVKPTPIPMQLFQATDLADPHWANKYEGQDAYTAYR